MDATLFERGAAFIKKFARPLELAMYQYHFANGSKSAVIRELRKFQNPDGGFAHALEPDNWNPESNPIATNDAIKILYHLDALDEATDMMRGVIRYLKSHHAFDEENRQWRFQIESNKDYPHAIWWEVEKDGLFEYNPTVALAAIMICYGGGDDYYKQIVREAMTYLVTAKPIGDTMKCYMLAYEIFKNKGIDDVLDLSEMHALIQGKLEAVICADESQYGVAYVYIPSDFFLRSDSSFISRKMMPLIEMELSIHSRILKPDGGFAITWQWYTEYDEFHHAEMIWRARITLDRLVFRNIFASSQS
ncbi:MAG: hypothetical protein PHW40_00080 [Candidatus Izemoplasmatales bacterium]|nr:hypothetical protein [Candidatus Izemoplasmatales bacterium]MDD5292693.1 hypothetical protein [Candidatus Izemoplasmatales bacterium]